MTRKYHNQPTEVDGVRFDSKREAQTWGMLGLLQKAGQVSDLRRQVSYPLTCNGQVVAHYIADFVYFDVKLGQEVVADAKGVRTQVYLLKKRMMRACHGIDIQEL